MDTPAVVKERDGHGVSGHSEVSPDKIKKVMFADESRQGLSLESVIFFEPYNHQEIDKESEKLGLSRSTTFSSLVRLPERAQAEDFLESAQDNKIQGFSSRPKRAHQETQQYARPGLGVFEEEAFVTPLAQILAAKSLDFDPFSAEPVHDTDTRTDTDTAPLTGVMGSVSMWYREHEDVFNPPDFLDSPASAEDRTKKKG